ncbi:MAG: ureidoglycolate lyase [Ruthenibacterium sp.]
MKTIESITQKSFAPFGSVLAFDENPLDPRFEVKVTEPNNSWRVAVFCVTIKETQRLERHVHSQETFTPISGTGILLCAAAKTPDKMHAFLLDTAVCLDKGVWHEVIALSEKALYQITENLTVASEFYQLAAPICVGAEEDGA